MKKIIYALALLVSINQAACKKDKNNNLLVKDIDGNLYHTVKIGNQTWMVENLKTTHFRDNSEINLSENTWSNITDPSYCWFFNNQAYKDTYGALYNWYAVNDPRGIAPEGWHVATYADWDTLIAYLGGDASSAGIKLKEAGNAHWTVSAGISSDNSSGFTALPGGYRRHDNSNFAQNGNYSHFWTSGEDQANGTVAYIRLDYNSNVFNYLTQPYLFNNFESKSFGFSVRCVKD